MRRQPIIRGSLRIVYSPVRVISWLLHRAADHPDAIDRLDASARTLWPEVPETAGHAERDPRGSAVWPVFRGEAAGTPGSAGRRSP
jgi:hypothetical protein